MKPTWRARQLASADSLKRETSRPSTVMLPPVGRSMPAMRLRSVVFPEPDGPMSARKSPRGTSNVMPFSTGTSKASLRYTFRTLLICTSASTRPPVECGGHAAAVRAPAWPAPSTSFSCPYQFPILQLLDPIGDDPLPLAQSAADFDQRFARVPRLYRAQPHAVVRADHRHLPLRDRPLRHPQLRRLVQLRVRALGVEEVRRRAHLREQALAGVENLDLDLHRGLGAVRGRDDLPQHAAPLLSRKGVDRHLGRLPLVQLD